MNEVKVEPLVLFSFQISYHKVGLPCFFRRSPMVRGPALWKYDPLAASFRAKPFPMRNSITLKLSSLLSGCDYKVNFKTCGHSLSRTRALPSMFLKSPVCFSLPSTCFNASFTYLLFLFSSLVAYELQHKKENVTFLCLVYVWLLRDNP